MRKGPGTFMRQTAIAMELPFGLVGPVLVGGFLGYLVDRWLGSMPIGMLVLGGLGFVAGVREVQRRMKSLESRRDGPTDK
ncbi:MAG: AtpZ/AtpI family protein [Candidatus Acidiferrales bacterium]